MEPRDTSASRIALGRGGFSVAVSAWMRAEERGEGGVRLGAL